MDRNLKQEALPNAISGHESRNWTALHDAVASGDDRRVQILLSSNADRLAKESSQGNTPLHEAASRGYSRCVKLICTPPASRTAQPKEKSRLKARVANTIEALHSGTLNIINNEGLSALHLAAQNGHNQSSRELLMAGADPDVQNKYGDTALHTACRYGHAGVTRILLSALCDPNKTNLNGDTALHITCAMGRRKLTRILLEADARLNVKNAQGETPQSIAVRKNYREINEILNTPKRIRNRREKPKDKVEGAQEKDKDKDREKDQDSVDKAINWSPYGCHYFPDPRSFPSPKLETLPKEPLKQGEQYFLDLAGHIHKGPVSVGNTCYCGPFFRHIENKLNCNRKSLKKYVHKTKERLGHKVQALAIKTNDQIEQLTRTMIEDRIRCESKRQYLNEYLRRGEPLRSTFDNQLKSQRVERTLSRCRSLDLLESNIESHRMPNSKSVELLENNNQAVAEVYHHAQDMHEESDEDSQSNSSRELPDNGNGHDALVASTALPLPLPEEDVKKSKLSELKLDFLKVSERLGDLLEKTSLIMERDNEQEHKLQLGSLSPEQSEPSMYSPGQQVKDNASSPNYDEYTHVQRRYPNSSETSNPSQNSNSWEFEMSSPQETQKYYHCLRRGDVMLNTVIKALRKDATFGELQKEEATLNENADRRCGDKLLYKAQQGMLESPASPSCSSDALAMSNLLKRQAFCLDDNFPPNPMHFYTNPMGPMQLDVPDQGIRRQAALDGAAAAAAAAKVEIRNSEIKYLKKSLTGQVKDMVAQLQCRIDSNQESSLSPTLPNPMRLNNNHSVHSNSPIEQHHAASSPILHSPTGGIYAPTPLRQPQQFCVPKDAYFHELPNRSRQQMQLSPQLYVSELGQNRLTRGYNGHSHHLPVPGEYINQPPHHLHGNVAPLRPRMLRTRLPPDVLQNDADIDVDLDELAAVGLYNNVSSLV